MGEVWELRGFAAGVGSMKDPSTAHPPSGEDILISDHHGLPALGQLRSRGNCNAPGKGGGPVTLRFIHQAVSKRTTGRGATPRGARLVPPRRAILVRRRSGASDQGQSRSNPSTRPLTWSYT